MIKVCRFRNMSSLLKKGELSEQAMCLSMPDRLNDPLEGAESSFFGGNIDIMTSFFKDYLAFLKGKVEQYSDKNVLSVDAAYTKLCQIYPWHEFLEQWYQYLAGTKKYVTWVHMRWFLHALEPLFLDALIGKEKIDSTFQEILIKFRRLNRSPKNFVQYLYPQDVIYGYKINGQIIPTQSYEQILLDIPRPYCIRNIILQTVWGITDTDKQQYFDSFPESFLKSFRNSIVPQYVVASFAMEDVIHSPYMWGTYGDCSKGVCLCFEIPDSMQFQVHEFQQPLQLEKVKYESDKDFWCESAYNLMAEDAAREMPKYARDLYLRKTTAWEQEHEYRILLPEKTAKEHMKDNKCILHYYLHQLKSIYIGKEADVRDIRDLYKTLEKIATKENIYIEVFQVTKFQGNVTGKTEAVCEKMPKPGKYFK